jgi:hypothetical protein
MRRTSLPALGPTASGKKFVEIVQAVGEVAAAEQRALARQLCGSDDSLVERVLQVVQSISPGDAEDFSASATPSIRLDDGTFGTSGCNVRVDQALIQLPGYDSLEEYGGGMGRVL